MVFVGDLAKHGSTSKGALVVTRANLLTVDRVVLQPTNSFLLANLLGFISTSNEVAGAHFNLAVDEIKLAVTDHSPLGEQAIGQHSWKVGVPLARLLGSLSDFREGTFKAVPALVGGHKLAEL